jgi:phosphoesterase RecJ-like protein
MRLIDTDASATTMVVYELLRAMKAAITPEIASSLLTGIITDTGSFKYQNTTPKALQISSHLVDSGADIVKINEEVFENRSMASMKLLGIGLTNLRSIRDGEIIWSTLSLEDFNKAGASDEQSEGIIAHMRSIRGAKMVALLREIKENRVRVSLRAREPYSVSEIAQRFEGGGHRLAAGCSLQASLVESERIILEAIEQWMDSLTSTKTPV